MYLYFLKWKQAGTKCQEWIDKKGFQGNFHLIGAFFYKKELISLTVFVLLNFPESQFVVEIQ